VTTQRSRYVTKKPFRTPREAQRDQVERNVANRINELESSVAVLTKALNARLEARPMPGELGELQRLLDNLRTVSNEFQSGSCSQRAMDAVTALIPWGRGQQRDTGVYNLDGARPEDYGTSKATKPALVGVSLNTGEVVHCDVHGLVKPDDVYVAEGGGYGHTGCWKRVTTQPVFLSKKPVAQ
jgi:hypothetical protein